MRERDWVVVGARPEELERQGYLRVGKEFPVFLHPETREEYALAHGQPEQAVPNRATNQVHLHERMLTCHGLHPGLNGGSRN